MKNQTFLCLLFTFMLLAGLQCPKDSNNPPTPAEPEPSLPPITTQGLNTVGCKIDGKVWVPYSKTSVPYLHAAVARNYNWTFEFVASQRKQVGLTLNMLEMTIKLINKDTIFLLTNDLNGNFCYYIPIDTIGADGYFTNQSLNNGYIHISRFDSAQQIISGTFNFTVINSNTKIKHEISEGRFDLRFNY